METTKNKKLIAAGLLVMSLTYVEMYKHLDTDLKSLKNTVDQL